LDDSSVEQNDILYFGTAESRMTLCHARHYRDYTERIAERSASTIIQQQRYTKTYPPTKTKLETKLLDHKHKRINIIMAQPRSSFCPQQQASRTRRCYLSAIALNNIGVRHMERHSYVHALETLKDSIALIKRVLLPAQEGDHCDNDCGERLAQLARQRLTQTKAGATPVMPLEVFTRASDGSLTSDKSQEDFSTAALQFPPLSSVAFPIRLEGANCMDAPEDLAPVQDLYLQAAMMLHNLGIAMLCLGKADKSKAHKMRSSALRLFRKSYSILVKHYMFLQDQKETSPNFRALGLPFLLMVVLDTYIPTLHESSQHENARELYEYLLQLRSFAASSINNLSSPRAAAAA
jgi:hypothetical protein